MHKLNHLTPAWCLRWLVGVASVFLLLAISGQASAATTPPSCTGAARSVTVPMPNILNVSSSAAIGTLLSNIVTTPLTPYFNCTGQAPGGVVGIGTSPLAGMTLANNAFGGQLIATLNNALLHVFNTNVPGVGIAIGVRESLGCGVSDFSFQDIYHPLTLPFPSPWFGDVCAINGTSANALQVEAAFVKTTAGAISPGTVNIGVFALAASFISNSSVGSSVFMQTGANAPGLISFTMSPVRVPNPSCLTPDVTVPLGTTLSSWFKGVGSVSPSVPFNLAFNDCTPGLTKIQFQLSSPNGLAKSPNVLNLASGSGASGVGVQIVDGNDLPIVLNTTYNLTSVNSTTNMYSVPFKAAYYQTGASVKAGTANAVMTFTVTYQ